MEMRWKKRQNEGIFCLKRAENVDFEAALLDREEVLSAASALAAVPFSSRQVQSSVERRRCKMQSGAKRDHETTLYYII